MCLATVARADTKTTNTDAIIEAGTDLACLDYQVVGGCLWMTCSPLGCEFDVSIRVRHRVPEAVVTSYPILNKSPWPDSEDAVASTPFAREGGASDEGGHKNREQALKFKNTEVFGSPAVAAYHAAAEAEIPFCTPLTWPMVPYFISTFDPNWRDPTIETPWTLANLVEGVNKGLSRFGGLFPRIGFVKQGHDYKASLVAAKRAAHFVRQRNQPHVYAPLDTWYDAETGQWPPSPRSGFVWQQLVPSLMSCRALPDIDDTTTLRDPYNQRINAVNGNAWQLWRTYSCCDRAGDNLILRF
jgi:integrating conjugative element protein (TIGR03756 family)